MDWFYFLLNLILLILSVLCGFYISKKNPRSWWIYCFGALCLLFLEGYLVHNPHIEYKLFPFIDYAYFRGWGVFGAFVVFGAGIHQSVQGSKRALIIFVIFLMCVRMFYWWTILFGLDYNFKENGFIEKICMQSTEFTCTPAACATLLKHYGVETTEKEMAELCLTGSIRGTSHIKAIRGLRLKLDEKKYRIRIAYGVWEDLQKVPKPCLININLAFMLRHTVNVAAMSDDKIKIYDSSQFVLNLTKEEFLKQWVGDMIWIEKIH